MPQSVSTARRATMLIDGRCAAGTREPRLRQALRAQALRAGGLSDLDVVDRPDTDVAPPHKRRRLDDPTISRCRDGSQCRDGGRCRDGERGRPGDDLPAPRRPRAGAPHTTPVLPVPLTPAQLKRQRAQQARAVLAQLNECYDAIKRPVDAAVPSGALTRDAALAIMQALPSVTPSTPVDQLVVLGLIHAVPKGWQRMNTTARYVLGRQVLVKAPVDTSFDPRENFLAYKADGPEALTYRATIVGTEGGIEGVTEGGTEVVTEGDIEGVTEGDIEGVTEGDIEGVTEGDIEGVTEGDDFLVVVDGNDVPMRVSRADIAEHNQPQIIPDVPASLNGIQIDWNDPMLKAKIHEGFARLQPVLENLDFDAAYKSLPGGRTQIRESSPTLTQQKRAVSILHNIVHMEYGGSGERHAGRLAIEGHGVCYDQTGVMAAILAPFSKLIGFDLQITDGQIYRHGWRPGGSSWGGAHAWLMVTYRPGMQMRVVDRTWQQTNLELDRAYSFWGDRYPLRISRISSTGQAASSVNLAPLTDADIDIRRKFALPRRERLFGDKGVHGRDNHQ